MSTEIAPRICPNDGDPLVEEAMVGQRVDRCQLCGGIFFDKGELESILRLVKHFHKVTLDEADIETVPCAERCRDVACVNGHGTMTPQDLGGIIIDACDTCGAVWLDHGEIVALKIAEASVRQNITLYLRLGN
ncbi:MAG: Zn-finger nucleic acid-binding protein [Myxococcota bacterium]|jgi:Zn-finger nucleic acid-binding protein